MTAGVSLSAPSFLSSFLRSFLSSFFFFFLVLGSSGPIDVTRFETHDTVLTEPSIRAAESLGHKFLNDYNLGKNTGISRVRTKKKKKKEQHFSTSSSSVSKNNPPPHLSLFLLLLLRFKRISIRASEWIWRRCFCDPICSRARIACTFAQRRTFLAWSLPIRPQLQSNVRKKKRSRTLRRVEKRAEADEKQSVEDSAREGREEKSRISFLLASTRD